jgi:hypothetical protein
MMPDINPGPIINDSHPNSKLPKKIPVARKLSSVSIGLS